jgi:hypothetical protein
MAANSAASFKFIPDVPADNEHTRSATGSHTMSAFAKQIRPYGQAELAAPLSLVGLIPTGNTGGGNVSGLRPMPVPADLLQIIDGARARAGQATCRATPPAGLGLSCTGESVSGAYHVAPESCAEHWGR